jgi:aminoglycoside phosphotransferase (APT) family kinase protein
VSGSAADGTREVRPGEEIDLERLAAHLRGAGFAFERIGLRQFPGGHSNLTYLLQLDGDELVLRRPPFGSKVKTAHDMGREHRVLSKLAPVYPKAPRPLLLCEDTEVIGAPFYLMERRRGVILRQTPPAGVTVEPATMRAVDEALVDTLVELHALDHRAIGLGDLGNPDGYVLRQVTGWAKRYQDARTDDIPGVEKVADWLASHIPVSPSPSVIHNDFKHDNIVFDPSWNVNAILDWEMATIGDPLMDLGTTLCYWVEPTDAGPMQMFRFGPTTLPGSLTRAQVVARYAARSGRDLGAIVFYYCFGLFKTAVVAQQIYSRWKQGLTRDERFGNFIHAVQMLIRQATDNLGRDSL